MKSSLPGCAAFLLAATLCAPAGAASLTTVGDLAAPTRPAGVPLNYVVTPNGFFHPSCVIAVADSDTVAADGNVVHADGSVSAVAACAYPRFGAQGQRVGEGAAQPDYNGWI